MSGPTTGEQTSASAVQTELILPDGKEREEPTYFLDTETTGTNPINHRIISVGIIKVRGNRELDSWEWKFEADREEFQQEAMEITGWPDNFDEPFDDRTEAFREIKSIIADQPIGGHNLQFDITFLRQAFRRNGLGILRLRKYSIDTAVIGSTFVQLGLIPAPSLENLCEFFGIDLGPAHQALTDARRAWRVYREALKRIQVKPAPAGSH